MTAKTIQFAKMAGLIMTDDGGEIGWLGSGKQHGEFHDLQAKDDRGEFENGYPWQSVTQF